MSSDTSSSVRIVRRNGWITKKVPAVQTVVTIDTKTAVPNAAGWETNKRRNYSELDIPEAVVTPIISIVADQLWASVAEYGAGKVVLHVLYTI